MLEESEVAEYSYICGEHFGEANFDDNGRLKRDSIPTLFPRRECLSHDHTYIKTEEEVEVGPDTGKFLFWFFKICNTINIILLRKLIYISVILQL